MPVSLVKSKQRVADHGEVFTPAWLVDELAPLIFRNGADSKSAQTFTPGHRLAHWWLGASGLPHTQIGQAERTIH